MSENRLLPVVIPQPFAISLTSPYGSPARMVEMQNLVDRVLFAGICLMIPEEAYAFDVTHKSILKDLFLPDGSVDIYAVAQKAASKRRSV